MAVALGLPAYDLAGADASAVPGTALAIKMIAYVGVPPVAQAFTDRLSRRSLLWLIRSLGYSTAQTPLGRLLRRLAHAADRPAVLAAQFALPHACWLICYPLAGYLGATAGMDVAFAAMALIGLVGFGPAWRVCRHGRHGPSASQSARRLSSSDRVRWQWLSSPSRGD